MESDKGGVAVKFDLDAACPSLRQKTYVGGVEHARPVDTLSPTRSCFSLITLPRYLLSLVDQSRKHGVQMLHPTKDSWNTTSVKMMTKSLNCTANVVITLISWKPRQQMLDSGSSPAGWFPLPDAVAEAFGLPPICPSLSVFADP